MSTCQDVTVRELLNVELCDTPIVAGIHISCFGKLNEGVSVPLEWLSTILAKLGFQFDEVDTIEPFCKSDGYPDNWYQEDGEKETKKFPELVRFEVYEPESIKYEEWSQAGGEGE